jgi:hypothetical protein
VDQRLAARQVRLTQMLRRPAVAGTAGVLLAVAAAGGTWYRWRESRVEWARGVAMAEAERLIVEQRFDDAYRVLQEAEPYVLDEPAFREHLDVATAAWTITTQPEGAEVMVRDFHGDPDAWRSLGHAPLRNVRIPRGLKVLRASMDGFQAVETVRAAERIAGPPAVHFSLRPAAETPHRMIFVGAPPSGLYGLGVLGPVPLAGFWIDKYEVTNRQFRAFVAAGGYGKREYWPPVYDSGGRLMSWDRAERMFVDRTGRPGPSLWQIGSPPEGQDDYPVSGVSWYEAAAYCHWLGKELPTLYHSSDGPEPVGGARRLGTWGAYDMAGNVKEWVWNETTSKRRFLLGGGWNEPSYMYSFQAFHDPAERLATHGFRCATYTGQPAAEAFAPIERAFRDYRIESPIGDEAFAVIAAMYHYSTRPLDARVKRTDDAAPYWRLQEVSFATAYGDERVSALLFLPKNAIPPYQVVVWYPGPVPFTRRMPLGNAERPRQNFEFLIRDGRAIALPAVKGSYHRHLGQQSPLEIWAEIMLASSQDIGRLIDYLETRAEFDTERVAYGGISVGASVGAIMTAMEPRFKASVLIAGGLQSHRPPPHADALNFVPRVKVPTLMVTGKHDFFFPYDRSQKPMFDLFRLPDSQKRLKAFESGHIPAEREEVRKEVIAWLDRHLGRVRRQ